MKLRLRVVVCGGFAAFGGQLAEGIAFIVAQLFQSIGKVGAVPEAFGLAGLRCEPAQVQRLDDDHHPRRQGHHQQQDGHRAGDDVALRPEIDETELRFH
jgi:hypothetical protein